MEKKTNQNYRWVVMIANFLICMIAYSGLTMWNMAGPKLAETFQISSLQSSFGYSFMMAGYAIGSIVESSLAARKGYRFAGTFGLVIMVIGIIGIPMALNYWIVLFFRFCQGWGVLWLVGVNGTVAWFPVHQRGLASGVVGAGLTAGMGIGSLVATALLNITGTWQGAFRIFGIILLISTAAWAMIMKEPPENLYPEESKSAKVQTVPGKEINVYKTMAAWLCALCLFLNCWQLVGFNTIASGYAMSIGYTEVQAGLILMVCGLTGIVATPVGGMISDAIVRKGWEPVKARSWTQAIPGFLVAAISAAIYPAIAPISFGIALFGAVLVGWGCPVTNATTGALPTDLLGDEKAAGKMFGLTTLVGLGAAGFTVPTVSAYLVERFGYTAAMVVLGIGALMGMLVSLSLPRFRLKD